MMVTEILGKVHVRCHNAMQMIPVRKDRQTYCVIFFVLMVTGAIKLIVRPKRLLLCENRIAKILVQNHGQRTLEDQTKQNIL